MYQDLHLFKTASALASHAATRQSVVSQNVANADTPGYAAKDIQPFSDAFDDRRTGLALKTTRADHIAGTASPSRAAITETDSGMAMSPNGNSVSIETEMIKSAETRQDHELALAAYQSGLKLLRGALGRS